MPSLDLLKKKIEESKSEKKTGTKLAGSATESLPETIDINQVEKIVQKMRKKYQAEGIEFGTVEGELDELRGIIAEGKTTQLEIQKIEELQEFASRTVRQIGKIYLKAKSILAPLSKIVLKMPQSETLSYYLFSANMRYSAKQYIAITITVSTLTALAIFVLSGLLIGFSNSPLFFKFILPVIISSWGFLFATIVMLYIPKQRANARGDATSIELPFALRHMSTELRSGIGLYKTMQAIATSDYGILSEEFAKTITEIEGGIDTKDALSRLALRTQSKALRNALMHMVRALKTGGNISEIMNTIAEDVGFELRMKTRDFAQRMNFFGVLFIFGAIWFPVITGILGGIRNSPLHTGTVSLKMLPLTPEAMTFLYIVFLPFILLCLIGYIITTQPKV